MRARRAVLFVLASALAVLVLGVSDAGATGPVTSVINGREAVQGQFPFMAFIEDSTGEGSVDECSGTVVSSNVILTAAHCVVNREEATIYPPEGFTVRTGNVFRGLATTSSVSRIAVLPGYTWRGEEPGPGDAAVLELSTSISAPVISVSSSPVAAGTNALMAGWGRLSSNGQAPLALHWGETVVQSPEYCAGQISSFDSSAQLCVLDYPTDEYGPCHGDSGGPLLAQSSSGTFSEIGITSYGDSSCPTSRPSVYTQSSRVASRLAGKIAEWAPPPPPAPPVIPSPSSPTAPPVPSSPPVAPSPVLPELTTRTAIGYAREALAGGLGYRFNRHRRLRLECKASTSTSQRCVTTWEANAFSYSGTVAVFYLLEGATVIWSDRYRINRIPTRCFRSCRPSVFRSP